MAIYKIHRITDGRVMMTMVDVIDAMGGYEGCAHAIKVPAGRVSVWKSRNSIPGGYWRRIVAAARRRRITGITYEVLGRAAEAEAERRNKAA